MPRRLSSQRTGSQSWRGRSALISAASAKGLPVTLLKTGMRGSWKVTSSSTRSSASRASAMRRVWKAPDTFSRCVRCAPASFADFSNALSAASSPETATPPGKRRFAGWQTTASWPPSSLTTSAHSALRTLSSSPTTESIPPFGPSAPTLAIASPRTLTTRSASCHESTPACTSAVYSPTESPPTAVALAYVPGCLIFMSSSAPIEARKMHGCAYCVRSTSSRGPSMQRLRRSYPIIPDASVKMS
mmetsp:Transcript_17135/g.56065  ORF Transcript_17135/g.56065 Transcript_17135/m.56065 type:complete len:245 (-) Transcript_17135:861-1595(-)